MESVTTLLGVGGGVAAVILVLALIVRGAISTAVTQAGRAEIVRLQGVLAESLEEKRQAFHQALDAARTEGARDLESYKAELQLASEVRRQLAARKVEALLKIAMLGEALQRHVLNVRPGHSEDHAMAIAKVHEFMNVVRSNSVMVSRDVASRCNQYAADLVKAEHDLNQKHDAGALERAWEAVDGFLQLAREELGVVRINGQELETSHPSPGE